MVATGSKEIQGRGRRRTFAFYTYDPVHFVLSPPLSFTHGFHPTPGDVHFLLEQNVSSKLRFWQMEADPGTDGGRYLLSSYVAF